MTSAPPASTATGRKTAVHPDVRASVPRRVLCILVVLAWVRAAALTGVFVAVGHTIDRIGTGVPPTETLIWVVACMAIAAAASGAEVICASAAESYAERQLRRRVIDTVIGGGGGGGGGGGVGGLRGQSSGQIISLATDSAGRAAHYRAGFLGPTIGALTTPFVVLMVFGITVDPVVAAILAAAIVIVPVVIGVARQAVRRVGNSHRLEAARLSTAFHEAIQGLSTIVAARAERRVGRALAERGERYRSSLMRVLAVNQILILIVDAAVSLIVVLLAAFCAISRVSTGEMTVGAALATMCVALLATAPVERVGSFFYIGIGGRAAERAISDRIAHEEDGRHPATLKPRSHRSDTGEISSSEHDAITLSGVEAGWVPGRPVVQGLSMRVKPGEHVALVGPSGIGKSTVSALIQAQLRPVAGAVVVAGLDTSVAAPSAVRAELSVVEQRTYLFQESIAENLRIARSDASEDDLWRALDLAGLSDQIRQMPAKLSTMVGEHGMRLSGGQSQRLAIARALLRDTSTLLLDEPTAQVDLAGEAAFLDALATLAAERTVLMIAHRPGAILAADRVITLTREGAH